jgi:membrane protein insertase Oxa1/YidC/SpoIIIJ
MTLYWVVTNIWTVGQQAILIKKFGPPPVPGSGPAGPKPGKGSSPNGVAKKVDASQVKTTPSEPNRPKPKGSGARRKRSGKK